MKLFYLFDLFQTRNLVVHKFWHIRWDIFASHLILLQRKKSSSFCYQLKWPLARTSKFQQQLLQLDLVWLPPTTALVQSIVANLKQTINFNLNQPRKPRSRKSPLQTLLQETRSSTRTSPPWNTSSMGANPLFPSQKVGHMTSLPSKGTQQMRFHVLTSNHFLLHHLGKLCQS